MPSVYGVVRDIESNAAKAGASVEVLGYTGAPTGRGTVTNSAGAFALDIGDNERLRFSYVGYTTSSLPASYFVGAGQKVVYLFPKAAELPGVTVTATTKRGGAWVLLAIAGYYISKQFKLF